MRNAEALPVDMRPITNRKLSDQTARTERTHPRFGAKGIVVLPGFAELLVTKIHDISMGGISFPHPRGTVVLSGKISMDIFIFDHLTDTEYYIDQVSGLIKAKVLFLEPISNSLFLRCCVAFQKLNVAQRKNLIRYCEQAKPRGIAQGENQSFGPGRATARRPEVAKFLKTHTA